MSQRTSHLPPSTWERLACGELGQAEKREALDHVEGCEDCAATWAALREVRAAAETFDPGLQSAEPAPRPGMTRHRVALALAAVLAAAFGLTLLRQDLRPAKPTAPAAAAEASAAAVPAATERSGTGERPRPVAPAEGTAGDVAAFSWQASPAFDRYTIELLDGDGALIWQSERLTGLQATWPARVGKVTGTYYWRVLAYDNGQSLASDLIRFELTESPNH